MIHYTFTVEGWKIDGPSSKREAARAAFDIPGVVAVGIDERARTVTVTSDRHIDYPAFAATSAAIGSRTISVCEKRLEMAS